MSLLLDTHVWVWSQEDPDRLGPQTRTVLAGSAESIAVATISTLEIARLIHLGDIDLTGSLTDWVSQSLVTLTARSIPLSHEVAREAYALPAPFHKDPADRILVATARIEHLLLLTADERILAYPHVRSRDARQ